MCVLIGAALCGIGMIAGSGIDYFLFHNNGTELDSLFFSSDLCWRVLCAGIIAPVVEEIIFRRYLVSTIAPYSERAAVIVSGILFALQHGNFSQFFYTLLLGMFWGYIYLRTGNVIYTIILHMIFNLTTVLFTVTIYQLFREIYLIWCVILVAFGIIGGIIAIVQRKKIFFAQMPDKTVFRQLFSSKGMVLYISYCIGIFWVNYAVEW
ncbi:MAG: CPBP family intramembrane metalloprotease [Lachnospiraceae bacterium]|nr:CPBP family intramembrane metalloprotease [Lachnospiraceae bacterium]